MNSKNIIKQNKIRIDYKIGEKIIIENGFMKVARSPHKLRYPKRLDKDLAYLAGYHLGDGYLEDINKTFNRRGRGRYEIDYADSDIQQINMINKIINEKFGHNLRIYKRPNVNLWIGRSACKVLHWFLNEKMGIPYGKKKIIEIPTWIKKYPSFMSAFLSGFFDAEGDVGRTRNRKYKEKIYYKVRVQLTQKDKNILLRIKNILEEEYEIKSYVFPKWHYDGFILKFDSRKSIENFKNKINFRNQIKKEKLNKLILKLKNHNL